MELVSALLVKSHFGCHAGIVREAGRGTSAVASRYQRTGEEQQTTKTKCSELQTDCELARAPL
jgi:hypothetical protein